jgi:hypothetical protein
MGSMLWGGLEKECRKNEFRKILPPMSTMMYCTWDAQTDRTSTNFL